jgi:hypothetical protein
MDAVTVAVLLMAAIKSRLILREFMEVRSGPRALRILCDGWLVGLLAGALCIYLSR